jgi:hypothetical protein
LFFLQTLVFYMEAATRFELVNSGFADRCLFNFVRN